MCHITVASHNIATGLMVLITNTRGDSRLPDVLITNQ